MLTKTSDEELDVTITVGLLWRLWRRLNTNSTRVHMFHVSLNITAFVFASPSSLKLHFRLQTNQNLSNLAKKTTLTYKLHKSTDSLSWAIGRISANVRRTSDYCATIAHFCRQTPDLNLFPLSLLIIEAAIVIQTDVSVIEHRPPCSCLLRFYKQAIPQPHTLQQLVDSPLHQL